MNQLTATVKQIEYVDNLHLVSFELGNQMLKMVSLELNELIEIKKSFKLSVKSTNISIAKNFSGVISYINQLNAKIIDVNNGILLSSIKVKVEGFELESLITLEASLNMSLRVGDKVIVLIKESEISVCG